MFSKAFLVFAAFVVLGCGTSQQKKEQAQLHLEIGSGFLKNGDSPRAMSALQLSLELDPTNPITHNNIALAYFLRNRLAESETHLKKALDLKADYSDARNNLGRVYIALNRYQDAERELATVITDMKYPFPEKAKYNLGLAFYSQNEFEKARIQFVESIKLKKDYCPSHEYNGLSLFQLKKYEKAIDSFDVLFQICGNKFEEGTFYAAMSAYHLGKKEQAIAKFEEVLRLFPTGKNAEKTRSFLKILR